MASGRHRIGDAAVQEGRLAAAAASGLEGGGDPKFGQAVLEEHRGAGGWLAVHAGEITVPAGPAVQIGEEGRGPGG